MPPRRARRLACPPIRGEDLSGPVGTLDVSALSGLGQRYADVAQAFGLELKVAFLMDSLGLGCGEDFRLRRPFFRLAQEPILLSWWGALQKAPLDPDEALAAASMMNGAAVAYRAGEILSFGTPGGLLYEHPDRAKAWVADLAAADRSGGDPIKQALYRFARIVMAHPFTDANGRFARAAVQASLARSGLIPAPNLALAPVFYLRSADIREAIGGLSRSCRWDRYFEKMGMVIGEAVRWVEALDRRAAQ